MLAAPSAQSSRRLGSSVAESQITELDQQIAELRARKTVLERLRQPAPSHTASMLGSRGRATAKTPAGQRLPKGGAAAATPW